MKYLRFLLKEMCQMPLRVCLGLIRLYQIAISPLLRPCCRFYPSCSCYGQEAFLTHGVFYGGWLTFKRLIKCGPFHPGGYDPVPPSKVVKSHKNMQCGCEAAKNMADK